MFIEAFLIGGALIGAGLWILAGRDLRDLLRRAGRERWSRTSFRSGRSRTKVTPVIDPLLPVRILKLAKSHGGTLTVSQAAMDLEVPIDHAEAGLEACVKSGSALPEYDVSRGHMLYRFPEFSDPADDPSGL